MPLQQCSIEHTAYRLYRMHWCLRKLTCLRWRTRSHAFVHRSKAAAAAAPQQVTAPAVLQSNDSWRFISLEKQLPRLLLIDGTNLACICAGSKHNRHSIFKQPVAARFTAWIDFLQAATAADAVIVAFDNKGSSESNVRAQLAPQYLNKRYRGPQQPGAALPGASLDGWAHLGAALRTKECCVVVHAAYGFEADDVLAAATQWARHLRPRPHVLIASSDSDMQQLLDSHTYWVQLLQVLSKQFPSGLQLHSEQSFVGQYSFPPAAYPAFLSLVGKPEASIPGVGLSAKLAKTLLANFECLDAILAAGEFHGLKPFGVADKQLGSGPNAAANRQAAARNMAVLRLHAEQQILPEQLQQCYKTAVAAWQQQQQQQHDRRPPSIQEKHTEHRLLELQQQQQQHLPAAGLAAMHPVIQAHMQQCQPYLQQLSSCLTQLGLQHKVGWLNPSGLWCDLVVRLHNSSSSSSHDTNVDRARGLLLKDVGFIPEPNADQWLVIQLLGPAELLNGPQLPGVSSLSYQDAVEKLAQQLRSSCGWHAQGTSGLGHAKRTLMSFASGTAKRQLSLLKSAGWKVAVVPFFETQLAAGEAAASCSNKTVLQYVADMLQEQCSMKFM